MKRAIEFRLGSGIGSRIPSLAFLTAVLWSVAIGDAAAAIITSAPFSLGYGFTGDAWNTTETSAQNTATTIGDFSFTPTVTGSLRSSNGIKFTNRVPTNGVFGDQSGTNLDFDVQLAAAYLGPTPGDAASIPDYQIRINISAIKIWAITNTTQTGTDLAFTETTVDHAATSTAITDLFNSIDANVDWIVPANWKQLVWTPDDASNALVNYTTPGTSFTRSFGLTPNASGFERGLDGFEIIGTVDLIYTVAVPAPEPSSFTLLLGSAVCWIARNKRPRSR